MTIRLNRVRWLMWISDSPNGRMLPRGMTGFRQWAWKSGVLENCSTGWGVRITEKGRVVLDQSIREHEAHGNFKPREAK